MRLKSIFALPIFTMLLGCVATQEDVGGVYRKQTTLEAKTAQLSQDIEALKRKKQASNDKGLKEQIAQLEGRIKGIEQAYPKLRERLDKLEKREATSGSPSASKPKASIGSRTTTPELESETSVFNEAYRSLNEGNYKRARDRFKFFLSKYPNSPKAPDAQYWIAESYYKEGKFEEAILEFETFVKANPKSPRVPLSYLKQGLSLINIGRKKEAKLFLQTLIDKFPKSKEAKIAKEKLKGLAGKN
jgi:tol-pal system protein YbgF